MQCFHCGREVRETAHRSKIFAVDYYRLHTGKTEWALYINKENTPPLRYLRLTHPIDILTCVHCYSIPEIRQKLDEELRGVVSFLPDAKKQDKYTPEAH